MGKSENNKAPQIRFKGFNEEWQLKSLSDLTFLENGFAFKSINFSEKATNTIVLTPGNVKIGGGFQHGKGQFYLENQYIPDKFILESGDIFVTMTDLTPTSQALGFPARVPRDNYIYLHNQRLGKLTGYRGHEDFLFYLLSVPKGQKEVVSTASGTTVKHTSPSKFLNRNFYFPIKDEQAKVGALFRELDQLIQQHQHKHGKLVALKLAMLQKMLPQHGIKIPKIRFKGFEQEWGKHRLGNIVDVCSGRDYKHLSPGDIPVYGTGGYMLSVNKALSYDKDAIGIGRKGTIDRPYLLKCPFWTVDTLFYVIPKEEYDLNFIYSFFQKIDWKKYDESTGVPSLSKTAINDIGISVPTLEEQQKIGRYFRQLDELISRHAIQLKKLKQVKSACLAKMFV